MDVSCASCGMIKTIDRTGDLGEIVRQTGYKFLWDISTGLTALFFCHACSKTLTRAFELLRSVIGSKFRHLNMTHAEKMFLTPEGTKKP